MNNFWLSKKDIIAFFSKVKLKREIRHLGRMIIKLSKNRQQYEHFYETVENHDAIQQFLIYNFLSNQFDNYRKQGLYIRGFSKQRRMLKKQLKTLI